MKKVAILTFVRGDNYGAVLQAYALQQAVLRRGCDCNVIDYKCRALDADYDIFPPHEGHFFYNFVRDLLRFIPMLSKRAKFKPFRQNKIKLTVPVAKKEFFTHITISQTSSRLLNILDTFGLSSRLIQNTDLANMRPVNWADVAKTLEAQLQKSFDYLHKITG